MLSIIRHSSAAAFLQVAEASFAQNEAANNLIYGIALRLAADAERFERPPFVRSPFLATVQEGDQLVCAALMTPPFRLVLYTPPDVPPAALPAAFDLLIAELQSGGWHVPGVTAETAVGLAFCERWQAATRQGYEVELQMRVFELRTVSWPAMPPGHLRQATADDADLVFQWYCNFRDEAVSSDPMPVREGVERSIREGNVYLWDDGGPVSLAARGRRLPHGYSVGPVYTPPNLRGRGYAGACTAALSQSILDGGAQFCTLFTDLSNPTSNAIYQRIGYRPVCDVTEYKLRG